MGAGPVSSSSTASFLGLLVAAAVLPACSGLVGGSAEQEIIPGLPDGPSDLPHGLRGEYFKLYFERVVDRVDPAVDMAWGDAEPAPGVGADHVSVRWTGFLRIETAATYTFATSNDDGVRLFVHDVAVIDDWRGHFPERHEGSVDLAPGFVPIRIEYFESDLGAEMKLLWSAPAIGLDEEVVPSDVLRAAPAMPDEVPRAPHPPFGNPVIGFDCPDPGVTAVDGGFYVVCTGGTFPIRYSNDLVMWSDTGGYVLPTGVTPWSANGYRNWAPEIHEVGDHYVAYFTAVNGANSLSIGAASATSPAGPYTDRGGPLAEDRSGMIDPHFFEDDDGKRYLLVKVDGNSIGEPTPIYIRELTPDGLDLAPGGPFVELIRNDPNSFEGGVVEGQWLVKHAGMYYLFYSANVYDHRYRTSVARSASLFGPYQKIGRPILGNNGAWVGPGHGSVVKVGSDDYFVYHAWRNDGGGGVDGNYGRLVLVDKIRWGDDGWPYISDGTPSNAIQVWPGD